jgi:hypothetical protein
VKIAIETCKDPSLVLIYGSCGVENCMVVSIETVHDAFEERKLFCLAPTTTCCGLAIGMMVFWPSKDLSLNDELVIKMFNQGDLIMDGVNNLAKK